MVPRQREDRRFPAVELCGARSPAISLDGLFEQAESSVENRPMSWIRTCCGGDDLKLTIFRQSDENLPNGVSYVWWPGWFRVPYHQYSM